MNNLDFMLSDENNAVEILLEFIAYCQGIDSDECGGNCVICARDFLKEYRSDNNVK